MAQGRSVEAVNGDVALESRRDRMVEAAVESREPRRLVNNAAVYSNYLLDALEGGGSAGSSR